MRRTLPILLLLLVVSLLSQAQTRRITGFVRADKDSALTGATIMVKGSTQTTLSGADGGFQLDIPDRKNVILLVNYVGYTAREVAVDNLSNLDIRLVQAMNQLDDVVVVGYGTARRKDLTGSVKRVNIQQTRELPNVSVMQSLQGTVPGLNVGAVDQPGENPVIAVRGQNSLSSNAADNAPLIVVDGIIYRGSIIDINPADIETVDILKDASAASVYGSQASNGVLIITTRKGTDLGKPVISYNGSFSFETPSNVLTPMKSAELDKFFRDNTWLQSRLAPDYLRTNPTYDITQHLKTNEIKDGYKNGLDNDWWGGLTRNGSINNHSVGIRGRTKDVGYFVSGGYTDVKGFMLNDQYKRYSMRLNLDMNINRWLKMGVESFMTSSDYSGSAPSVTDAFALQPWAPIYDSVGNLILYPEGSLLNPYAQLNVKDSDKRLNLFGVVHAEVKLPINGLNYRINLSTNYRTTDQNQYNPYGANLTGLGYKNADIASDWTIDNILTYRKSFNRGHDLNVTGVYGAEKRTGSYTNASARRFNTGVLGFNRLQAGDPTLNTINTGAFEETSLYMMGRAMYSFNNKYLFTGTVRYDGFSGFGLENKMGFFPSLAVGWVISEENFIKESVTWLNQLKLRASYGSVGRRAVNRYQTLAVMNSSPSYIYGDGGSTTIGQWIASMANEELGWETTTGLNLGLDFSMFKSRIFGSIDYYNNNTRDILYAIQLPQTSGFASIPTNIGKVHNWGLEFQLTGDVIKNKDFNWQSGINFSMNRNKIVSILGADNDKDGKEDDLVANGLFIGRPQQVIYDYVISGMWQLADKDAGLIPNGFQAGTYKIRDLDSNGSFSATKDRAILGYVDPNYRVSWSNRFDYKNLSLYILINSIQGGGNYYMGDDSPYSSGAWSQREQLTYLNVPSGAWDYWMPENPNGKYRRLDVSASYAPRPYTARSFVRVQDVSLSYRFATSMLSRAHLKALTVYMSGKNLLTFTKWQGWDPETGLGFAPGIPLMKNFTFGLNLEF